MSKEIIAFGIMLSIGISFFIGYAAGKVEQSDMFVVCVFGIIVVFIIILIIWKILNYINKRRAIDEINKKL